MSNIFIRVFRSWSYPPFHHWWYDFPLLYWYGLIIIHSTFLWPYFVSHHLFPDLRSTFYPFPTYWYTFMIRYFLHIIHMFHWWSDHLSFLLFHHRYFIWLPLGPWLMRFFYALHLVHKGMGLIIGYLSLVSFHFFHPITLAYFTSRVLRPPWGHEIRCYLWQPLLRLVFGIWLIYGRHPISSFGRCSLMLGGDLVMDVDDWFILWMIFDVV